MIISYVNMILPDAGVSRTSRWTTGEYEFIVLCKPLLMILTGVYLNDSRICYTKRASFIPADLEMDFIKRDLRVYRPDLQCWSYQYNGSLYWAEEINPSLAIGVETGKCQELYELF